MSGRYFLTISFCMFSFCFASRDPFSVLLNTEKQSQHKILDKIELLGIIKTDTNLNAILKKGINQEIVGLNESVWGYKVLQITLNEVVLLNQNKKLKLLI